MKKNLLHELHEARSFLEACKPQVSLFEKLLTPPKSLKKKNYEDLFQKSHPEIIINDVKSLQSELSRLKEEKTSIEVLRKELKPYKNVSINLSNLSKHESVFFNFYLIDNTSLEKLVSSTLIDTEIIYERKKESVILTAVHSDNFNAAVEEIKEFTLKEIEFPIAEGSPDEVYKNTHKRIKEIEKKIVLLQENARELLKHLLSIEIIIQTYGSIGKKEELFKKWLLSENAFIISGWIKEESTGILENLCNKFDSVEFEIIDKQQDAPPVAFKEHRIFSPFQLITRLYSMPSEKSMDPSAVTSVFFAIFFGLCLTDAGYGVVLSLAALFGIWKFKTGKDLLWILFWGGMLTIAAGILTGGIFGDLFRNTDPFIKFKALTAARDSMVWFDPMKEPMVFFRLVLFLGVIHVFTGLIMGIISNLKNRRYADVLIDKLTWLIIVLSLLSILFSSDMCVKMSLVSAQAPPLPESVQKPAVFALIIMSAIVVLFSARDEESLLFRFFIGFLKLIIISGIFSYLGDILSYIRLMALGMVTAGIGMAINTIAFMLYDIPFVGVILTIAVLLGGHIFNMAINLLGAFVHTLRLQYVEFFSKFFIGGGKAFNPLSMDETYITIIY